MKALVYEGVGQRAWKERERPAIEQPTDAVVWVTHTTICGTDLHILKGDVPAVTSGRTLGHEGIGVIEEVGGGVSGLAVLISCITSCGHCDYFKQDMYAHCRDDGWILGHTIDGTQAEIVRIPHAANNSIGERPGQRYAISFAAYAISSDASSTRRTQTKPGIDEEGQQDQRTAEEGGVWRLFTQPPPGP